MTRLKFKAIAGLQKLCLVLVIIMTCGAHALENPINTAAKNIVEKLSNPLQMQIILNPSGYTPILSKDGKKLAIFQDDNHIRVFNTAEFDSKGDRISVVIENNYGFSQNSSPSSNRTISPYYPIFDFINDNKLLFTIDKRRTLQLWDTSTGQITNSVADRPGYENIVSVIDKTILVLENPSISSTLMYQWDIETNTYTLAKDFKSKIVSVNPSKTALNLLYPQRQIIDILNLPDMKRLATVWTHGWITDSITNKDASKIAVRFQSGHAKEIFQVMPIIKGSKKAEPAFFSIETDRIGDFSFNNDGSQVIAVINEAVKVFDSTTGTIIGTILSDHFTRLKRAYFSTSNNFIIIVGNETLQNDFGPVDNPLPNPLPEHFDNEHPENRINRIRQNGSNSFIKIYSARNYKLLESLYFPEAPNRLHPEPLADVAADDKRIVIKQGGNIVLGDLSQFLLYQERNQDDSVLIAGYFNTSTQDQPKDFLNQQIFLIEVDKLAQQAPGKHITLQDFQNNQEVINAARQLPHDIQFALMNTYNIDKEVFGRVAAPTQAPSSTVEEIKADLAKSAPTEERREKLFARKNQSEEQQQIQKWRDYLNTGDEAMLYAITQSYQPAQEQSSRGVKRSLQESGNS